MHFRRREARWKGLTTDYTAFSRGNLQGSAVRDLLWFCSLFAGCDISFAAVRLQSAISLSAFNSGRDSSLPQHVTEMARDAYIADKNYASVAPTDLID